MFSEDQANPGGTQPRSNTRVPLETEVNLEFEKFSGFISEYSSNISQGGMFVRSQEPKPVGTILSFEFKLRDNFKLIQGLGEVSWVRTTDQGPNRPPGMGIRFHELDERSRELITTMVDNYIKGGGKPFDLDEAPPSLASSAQPTDSAPVTPKAPPKNTPPPPKASDGVEEDFQALFMEADGDLPDGNTDPIPIVQSTPPIPPQKPTSAEETEVTDLFADTNLAEESTSDVNQPLPSPMRLEGETETLDLSEDLPNLESPPTLDPLPPQDVSLASRLEGSETLFDHDEPKKKNKKKVFILGGLGIGVLLMGYVVMGPILGWFGSTEETPSPPKEPPRIAQKKLSDQPKATEPTQPEALPKDSQTAGAATGTDVSSLPKTTPAPAVEPTMAPTAVPTTAPTLTPIPTQVPTVAPTVAPTPPPRIVSQGTLTKIERITWTRKGNQTIVTVWGNAPIREEAYKRIHLGGTKPREVIKIFGISSAFSRPKMLVGNAELQGIRTGHHPGNELHIVLDLANPRIQVLRTATQQNQLTFTLGPK